MAFASMGYKSATSPEFLDTVKRWIAEKTEVLSWIRFSHAAGSNELEFFTSFDAFRERLGQLRPKTCVTVFRQPQLPLRGSIDDELIAKALALVADGQEYLIAGLDRIHCGSASWIPGWEGETHAQLIEDLENNRGLRVAIGPYPAWLVDNEDVSSAVIPESDGTVVCGVY